MSQVTRTKAAGQRVVTLLVKPAAGKAGILGIGQEGDAYAYWLDLVPSDWGAGYVLRPLGGSGESYAVCLDHEGGTCDCRGFERWRRCKHVEALQALQARGELPTLPALPRHDWTPDPLPRCLPDLHEGESYKPGHSSDLPF